MVEVWAFRVSVINDRMRYSSEIAFTDMMATVLQPHAPLAQPCGVEMSRRERSRLSHRGVPGRYRKAGRKEKRSIERAVPHS
jgi:hypothetical protein